jgi:GTPase SAR1 family protein
MPEDTQIQKRLEDLKNHLAQENPILRDVVDGFRELDLVARQLGILEASQSYVNRVSWWPMISVLGTFSSGKSTFINHYLGRTLQRTGTQAVDDKFTVICFAAEDMVNVLPGVALDADPRFPFYQVSHAVQEIVGGDSRRVDAYLQLKTCPSEQLRGRILIDSPGFDADKQRTETLRLTKHIIGLSDLVLIFFDARHPEPGAMRDTLEHLVAETIDRPDSNKFLYILNQIDVTAREDNFEEVVAAWQRSLAQAGLTAGRFYRIYNPEVAVPIVDAKVKERYEAKRDADMADILTRINQVGIERAYRIVGVLEQATSDLEYRIVPQLQETLQRWRNRTLIGNVLLWMVLFGLVAVGANITVGSLSELFFSDPVSLGIELGVVFVILWFLHLKIANKVADSLMKKLQQIQDEGLREGLKRAFRKNTCLFSTLFMPLTSSRPKGWNQATRKRIAHILSNANQYVQHLNDRFTNPSGKKATEESTLSPKG